MPRVWHDTRSIWLFSLAAAVFVLLCLGISGLIDQQQRQVLDATRRMQEQTVPQIVRLQRLGRNLEQMRHAGEQVLGSATATDRQNTLLLLNLVSHHPSLLSHPQAAPLAEQVARFLTEADVALAQDPAAMASWRQRWQPLARQLSQLADEVMTEAAHLMSDDLDNLSDVVSKARVQLLGSMLLVGGFSLALLASLHRQIFQPLAQIHRVLLALNAQAPVPDLPPSKVMELRSVASAITALHRAMRDNESVRQQLEFQAHHDALTELPNRRHFMAQAQLESRRLLGRQERAIVGMADLDFFKRVNDEHSHATGDDVLRQCAHLLRSALRANDLVCRYGGEEFAFLLPEAGPEQGQALAERLRQSLASHAFALKSGDTLPPMTVSVGLAVLGPEGLEKALAEADQALYLAKRGGRNQVVLHWHQPLPASA